MKIGRAHDVRAGMPESLDSTTRWRTSSDDEVGVRGCGLTDQDVAAATAVTVEPLCSLRVSLRKSSKALVMILEKGVFLE